MITVDRRMIILIILIMPRDLSNWTSRDPFGSACPLNSVPHVLCPSCASVTRAQSMPQAQLGAIARVPALRTLSTLRDDVGSSRRLPTSLDRRQRPRALGSAPSRLSRGRARMPARAALPCCPPLTRSTRRLLLVVSVLSLEFLDGGIDCGAQVAIRRQLRILVAPACGCRGLEGA